MKKKWHVRTLSWSLLLVSITFCFQIAYAEISLIEEITQDFRPLAGYVVRVQGTEVIFDLDESSGIAVGDLFSVLGTGEELIHPVTQKVIGTLEKVKGVIQAIQLKAGYSFAHPIGPLGDIRAGDPIRRYEKLNATFWDYTKEGKPFFTELRFALPALQWQDYEAAQRTRPAMVSAPPGKERVLYFIMTASGIDVRDPDFNVIRTYDRPGQLTVQPSSPAPASVRTAPGPAPSLTAAAGASTPVPNQGPVNIRYDQFEPLAKLPATMVMADFIQKGPRLLMAATDGSRIYILEVADEVMPLTEGVFPFPGQILALSWWQPALNGPLFLSVVTWTYNDVQSALYSFKDKNLVLEFKNIRSILGAFDQDGDKLPETLYSQEFDNENFFGRRIREVTLKDGRIKYRKPAFKFPARFTVVGGMVTDLTGDGQPEVVFTRNGVLRIYQGTEPLFASPKQMGGSLSFLSYDVDPTAKNVMTTSASFEVAPVAADIDGDGQVELLSPASEKSFIGAARMGPGIRKSWMAVVKFRDRMFMQGTLGGDLKAPIQGLTVKDKRILFVSSEPATVSGKGGGSYLLSYPILN